MFKRLTALHLALCLLFLGLLGRIAYIGTDGTYTASSAHNSVALTIDEKRGTFYDCNMNELLYQDKEYVAIIRPTEKVITTLDKIFSKDEVEKIRKRLIDGKPILQRVSADTPSTDDIPIITVSKRYSATQTLSNLLGNCFAEEKNRFGLEKSFYDFLSTDSTLKIKYYVDAQGRMLQGDMGQIVSNNYASKRGVQLTINKEIQKICEEAVLQQENFKKGSVVVLDVASSKILAMVSQPNVNLTNLSESLKDENSPFINRSLTSYTVGSVFKPAVACAAIENGLSDFTHNCTGSIQIGDTVFNCHKHEGHGFMDMQNAIGQSCNPYFIALGQEIGGTFLLNKITDFGFGEATQLAEGLVSMAGVLPTMNEINEKGNLANFSFGQGDLMATPLQIANMVACIANNGVLNKPTLIESLIGDGGEIVEGAKLTDGKQIVKEKTAQTVKQYMIEAVENGSGRNAKPEQGGAGGKTATAQSGWIKENGEEVLHVWFAGFYPANNPRYAIAIMDEDGSSGATDCCPIFKTIVDEIEKQNLT